MNSIKEKLILARKKEEKKLEMLDILNELIDRGVFKDLFLFRNNEMNFLESVGINESLTNLLMDKFNDLFDKKFKDIKGININSYTDGSFFIYHLGEDGETTNILRLYNLSQLEIYLEKEKDEEVNNVLIKLFYYFLNELDIYKFTIVNHEDNENKSFGALVEIDYEILEELEFLIEDGYMTSMDSNKISEKLFLLSYEAISELSILEVPLKLKGIEIVNHHLYNEKTEQIELTIGNYQYFLKENGYFEMNGHFASIEQFLSKANI